MRRVLRSSSIALIFLVAGAAAVTTTATTGCGAPAKKAPPPAPPREIEVLTLAPTEARVTGEYLGSMLSRASVNVLPQVAGYVRSLHVKPGQTVAAGAPLVEIDARESSAALASASAGAEAATARLALATQSRSRVEAMFSQGLTSAQELDQVRAEEASAKAAVRAAQAQVSQRKVAVGYYVVRATARAGRDRPRTRRPATRP